MSRSVIRLTPILALAPFVVLPVAHADDWGCQVLLCLSNPAGPTAVPACVPPIERLWAALRKPNPDPFPTCTMANGPGGASWAAVDSNYYDPCPSGTNALPSGQYAFPGNTAPPAHFVGVATLNLAQVSTGIGDGKGASRSVGMALPSKVCVAGLVGHTWALGPPTDAFSPRASVPVGIYQTVVLLPPAASPNVVDVYVNNALTRLVRY